MLTLLVFSFLFFCCCADPLYWSSSHRDSRDPFRKETYFRESIRERVPSNSRLTQILLCPFDAPYNCANSSDPLRDLEDRRFGKNKLDELVDIQSPIIGSSDDAIVGMVLEQPRVQWSSKRLERRCTPRCDYNKDWSPTINPHSLSNRGIFNTPPAQNRFKSLFNLNMVKDYADMFAANSYYGKREKPLFVEEPRYMILETNAQQDQYLQQNGHRSDPFIPPRGRKNSPLFESLRHGGDVFIPNRGRKDKLSDIFKYDETFFPNRGKKDAVNWADFDRNEQLKEAKAKKQAIY